MATSIVRVILYVQDIPKTAEFYQRHFGMTPLPANLDGWLELSSPGGGCTVALHQASRKRTSGAAMKLVFGVPDVRKFLADREADGLKFGPLHVADDVEFANTKDPAGNSIQISNRGVARG